jgi:hypothetical protein
MLRPPASSVFESLNEPSEIALEFSSALKRIDELTIAELAGRGLARLVIVDVPRDELPEHFADGRIAGRALEGLPRRVIDVDTSHVVATLGPSQRRRGEIAFGPRSADLVAAAPRHDVHVCAGSGGKFPLAVRET